MKHELSNQLTKQSLAASLRRQLEKKPLSKVTVSEIATDCGINRKTFYYHFTDIYDLFRWMLEQETVSVVKKFDLLVDFREAMEFVMDSVMNNKHIVNSAYDSMGRAGLAHFFYADFSEIIRKYIDEVVETCQLDIEEDYRRFQGEFFTAAISGMILKWCASDPKNLREREQTLDFMEQIFMSAIPRTMKQHVEERARTNR